MKQSIDLQVNDILIQIKAPFGGGIKRLKKHLITKVTKTQASDEDGFRFYQRGRNYYEVGGNAYSEFSKVSSEELDRLENEIEKHNAPIRRRILVNETNFRALDQSKIDRIYSIIKE